MVTGINESETLTKHISCQYKCKFDDKKFNSNKKWNNNICWCECKSPKELNVCKKDYIWNPATFNCENGKYLASIIDYLVITSNQIIETTKTVLTKSTSTSKQHFAFLLSTNALFIAVSIIVT